MWPSLVSLADKIHNARMIVRDLCREGDGVWRRFHGGKDGTIWYYRSLVRVFRRGAAHKELVQEFARLVSRMCVLAKGSRSLQSRHD